MNETTMEVPIALQQLIKTNNDLLRAQQARLVREIEEANAQMMGILKLDPAVGWRLDMERMVYVRIEVPPTEEASTEE
jgi:hypothetical protein